MGYSTDFWGSVTVEPALSAEEIAFINKFSASRRMSWKQGPYFVDGNDDWQGPRDPDIIDYNGPPAGQPGLWCNWIATEDGKAIEWNGAEKFYESALWMKYLIEHFIGSTPKAAEQLPFLKPHTLNGEIGAQGEESGDRWDLIVTDNKVYVKQFEFVGLEEMEI